MRPRFILIVPPKRLLGAPRGVPSLTVLPCLRLEFPTESKPYLSNIRIICAVLLTSGAVRPAGTQFRVGASQDYCTPAESHAPYGCGSHASWEPEAAARSEENPDRRVWPHRPRVRRSCRRRRPARVRATGPHGPRPGAGWPPAYGWET